MDAMQLEENNSRKVFLKRLALGFVSVFGLGLAGFGFKKHSTASYDNFKIISEKDANDLIRNMHSPKQKQIKPEPPPASA